MMRMFPRDEEKEAPAMVAPHPSVDPVLVQAIDTVARRLIIVMQATYEDLPGVSDDDWARLQARADQLVKELDRGEGPFQAAYNLLKARAEP